MTQILLFRDPCPLVERLGRDFFRQLPESPGVYLMRGQLDELLYVGKAKNLRQRLGHYRVANPDRMPRRHLRLLRAVERIDIEHAQDEKTALEREAHLLRELKPRFNRAGTWPAPPRYVALKWTDPALLVAVTATPEAGWHTSGPMGSSARYLLVALVRLLWLRTFPERSFAHMPSGWFRGQYGDVVTLDFGAQEFFKLADLQQSLVALLAGAPEPFKTCFSKDLPSNLPTFDKAIFEEDLEFVCEWFARRKT